MEGDILKNVREDHNDVPNSAKNKAEKMNAENQRESESESVPLNHLCESPKGYFTLDLSINVLL